MATLYAALIPLYNNCTKPIDALPRFSDLESESSFSQKDVFSIIADVIRQLHHDTRDFVPHEAIVAGLLDHPKGAS